MLFFFKSFRHSHLNSEYQLLVLTLHFLESLLFSYFIMGSRLTILVSSNK